MAWLYGIPYEALLSPLEAARANLWTLGLVSARRVALMVRVVSVVFNLRVRSALPLVTIVADSAALTALHLAPLPIICVIGGISPANEIIAVTAFLVKLVGWLTLPIWILLTGIFAHSSLDAREWMRPRPPAYTGSGGGAPVFTGLSIAVWAALLPVTQPAQHLARRVERTYRADGPAAALTLMSAHDPVDFPPGWRPPPRQFPSEAPTSEFLDKLEALAGQPQADWIRALYFRRFRDRVNDGFFGWPDEPLSGQALRLVHILTRLPEGSEMARALLDHYSGFEYLLQARSDVPKDERSAMEGLFRLAGKEKDVPPPRPDRGSP
jgi:hypothetical protein